MATIHVPAPDPSAFNKHRPVSDLLRGQLRHFHHLEETMPPEMRSNMTRREMATENGAARYIAHITNALKTMKQEGGAKPIPIRRQASRGGLAIAAAAAEPAGKPVRGMDDPVDAKAAKLRKKSSRAQAQAAEASQAEGAGADAVGPGAAKPRTKKP